ncbi:tetraketide alpha-pyrone reductase 2-like isoform X2 [Euphorbia lathyris]|uniref:tetraketide alpha-pyrone reductase 2-like isoform X2 n=1 Tax=Euphorbia lathyris TaxID=212925 RepID=UPI003313A5F5
MPEYCVTGGTGFIAAYLVKSLLQNGHTVRTTVRDPGDCAKVGFLSEFPGAEKRLKIMKADLMVVGSFDEAIEGVDGVFHTASPVLVPYDNNIQETLIKPCIDGTKNVLSSCSKASSVKRVVLWYAYAKTVAEKEAWRIADESGINLVVVNPSFVVGPLLAPQPTSTLLLILSMLKGVGTEYPNTTVGFVHIDDVVAAHILAMEDIRASGRLICSSSVAHWSQIIQMLKPIYPSYPYQNRCSSQEGDNKPHSMDTTKITQLGFPPFKTLQQMFNDCINSFQLKGFL